MPNVQRWPIIRSKLLWLGVVAALSGGPDVAHSAGWTSLDDAIAVDIAPIAPPLVTREQWKARPALPGMKPQTPRAIIIHHTALPANAERPLEAKLRNLQSFSQRAVKEQRRGAWGDVPYHYYIDINGRIGEGRDVHYAGDTNTPYPIQGYIQVVLEGNFDKEEPTDAQLTGLRRLLVSLMLAWNVPLERISVHKDHARTSCPGRNFMAILPQQLEATADERRRAVASVCTQRPSAAFARLYCAAR